MIEFKKEDLEEKKKLEKYYIDEVEELNKKMTNLQNSLQFMNEEFHKLDKKSKNTRINDEINYLNKKKIDYEKQIHYEKKIIENLKIEIKEYKEKISIND